MAHGTVQDGGLSPVGSNDQDAESHAKNIAMRAVVLGLEVDVSSVSAHPVYCTDRLQDF